MKNEIENKLQELGITLPNPPKPVASYVSYVISSNLIYVSGQLSMLFDKTIKGKLGHDLEIESGIEGAKFCAINLIAQAKSACLGDLSKIKKIVQITAFVNSSQDFIDHPKVVNGASDLLKTVFGDKGSHSRIAIGTASLPLGVAVEIAAIFEI